MRGREPWARLVMSSPADARLFPDFAAVPTPAERRSTRAYWQARQPSMLDVTPDAAPSCAACASSSHPTDACPHGAAPTLTGDNQP